MLPCDPPPANVLAQLVLPELPLPQRQPFWAQDGSLPYTLSTHIAPAAFLRSSADVELPVIPADIPGTVATSKEQRTQMVKDAEYKLRELRARQDSQGINPSPKVLWLCLNRYVRTSAPTRGGHTLFLAHANGFNKETWEPMLRYLLSSPNGQTIDEVWAWESINHGDSGLLNVQSLNSLASWWDSCRDLLCFLINYLPTSVSPGRLPVHLLPVTREDRQSRLANGFNERTLIAVGHSFGGCLSILSAATHPQLFSGLILIDPIVVRPPEFRDSLEQLRTREHHYKPTAFPQSNFLTFGALGRRNIWHSKEEVMQQLLQSSFFQRWDKDVLRLYVDHGIYEQRQGIYRLKTHPLSEAISFAEWHTGNHDAWLKTPRLDDRIQLKWIMPAADHPQIGTLQDSEQRISLRPNNSTSTRVKGAGHLIVQEAPSALADEIGIFVAVSRRQSHQKL